MSLKRSRLELHLDILKAIKKGTSKPTRIMYRTNLSWKPLMKILNSLVDQDLIIRNGKNGHVTHKITGKGKNVLEYFSMAMESIEIR
jgi:predicted transcriptional regulator